MRTVRNSSHLLGGERGCLLPGGIPECTEAEPPPCGQTGRCKNITFATSLRTVINEMEYLLVFNCVILNFDTVLETQTFTHQKRSLARHLMSTEVSLHAGQAIN